MNRLNTTRLTWTSLKEDTHSKLFRRQASNNVQPTQCIRLILLVSILCAVISCSEANKIKGAYNHVGGTDAMLTITDSEMKLRQGPLTLSASYSIESVDPDSLKLKVLPNGEQNAYHATVTLRSKGIVIKGPDVHGAGMFAGEWRMR